MRIHTDTYVYIHVPTQFIYIGSIWILKHI